MADGAACPTCGTGVAEVAFVDGVCPRCVLSLALAPDRCGASGDALREHLASRLGDYQIIEELARGGMGSVYRARHRALEREVALKVIHPSGGAGSRDFVERFRFEARAAGALDHPGIVPIYEVGECEGEHFLAMKLLEGGNLAQELAAGPVSAARAAAVVAKVARAVHYAHERGVLHRDIKPTNVLLDRAGEPYLTDFGLAKLLSETAGLTLTEAVMGTPSYMAPEQATGRTKHVTTAADVYSLGAILYELLTGRPPFREATPVQTLRQVVESEPVRPRRLNPKVDAELETICLTCLEKDARRRYASAAALADDLERWTRHEPIFAHRAGPVRRFRRWVRRNPLAAAFMSLLMVSLIGAAWLLSAVTRQVQAKEHLIDVIRAELSRDLEAFWKDDARRFVDVGSEKLAVLAGRDGYALGGAGRSVSIGAHWNAEGEALKAVRSYVPLLLRVERQLERDLGVPVRINFRLYKFNPETQTGIVAGDVDVMRMGPYPYLLAKRSDPRIVPLVRERTPGGKGSVIVVRRDSAIHALEQLRGCAIAAGHETSTSSGFWVPAQLCAAGITKRDLSKYVYHDRQGNALQAVVDGQFDGAITGQDKVNRSPHRDAVRVLAHFPRASAPWVARPGIDPGLAASLRRALTSVHDAAVLESLPDDAGAGFEAVTDQDFDEMRQWWDEREAFFQDNPDDGQSRQ